MEKTKNKKQNKTLWGINSRLSDTEACISDLKDKIMKTTQSEQQKEKKKVQFKKWEQLKGPLGQHQIILTFVL